MSYQHMTDRLVDVIRELHDYLGPEARGLSDEDVVHRVMRKALDFQRQLSELKPKEPPHRWGQL
jgi:hypothetical protein